MDAEKEVLWGFMRLKAHSCSRDRTTETTAEDLGH